MRVDCKIIQNCPVSNMAWVPPLASRINARDPVRYFQVEVFLWIRNRREHAEHHKLFLFKDWVG